MIVRNFGLVLLLGFAATCGAQQFSCTPDDAIGSRTRSVSGFSVTLTRVPDYESPAEQNCRFVVRDGAGRLFASGADAVVNVLPEMYILRIGTNDLVVEHYAGGTHRRYKYLIVTPTPTPHVAASIENEEVIDFMDYRGIELNDLVTCDGGFLFFDALAPAVSPCPRVFLRFVRGQLTDVGRLHKAMYDEDVTKARGQLTPYALADFRRQHSPPKDGQRAVECNVLSIVLAYLYSGREEQAWKELAAMWPPADQERIKRDILNARSRGVLRYAQGAQR